MLALVDVCPGTVCLALTLPLWQRWSGGRGAKIVSVCQDPVELLCSVGLSWSEWRQLSLEKLGPVAQACYPRTWEAEAGTSQFHTSLGNLARSCLKIQKGTKE